MPLVRTQIGSLSAGISRTRCISKAETKWWTRFLSVQSRGSCAVVRGYRGGIAQPVFHRVFAEKFRGRRQVPEDSSSNRPEGYGRPDPQRLLLSCRAIRWKIALHGVPSEPRCL